MKPKLEIVSSPHAREPGDPPPACPPEDFEALKTMPLSALTEIGMRRWGREEDHLGREHGSMLWLFPGEWYEKIPAGLAITTIGFEQETFAPGVTDDGIRFGCLSYGILREDDKAL